MNLTDIIKQQKEGVREEWLKAPFFNQFREGELQLLDTLTSQTVHATALAVIEMCEKQIAIHTQLANEYTGILFTDGGIKRDKTNPHIERVVELTDLIQSLKAQLLAEPLPDRPLNNERE
jgi:hypothetical protein